MATIYPTGIDTYAQLPLVVDLVSPVRADDVNRVRDAVVAVETELGINPSGIFGTVKDRLDSVDSLISIIPPGGGEAVSLMIDYLTINLETPSNKTYNIVQNVPYDGYVYSVASKSSAGTCTAQFNINGVALGDGPNSVSTAEDIVFHTSTRDFVVGDDFTLTISANSGATDVVVTVVYIRFVEQVALSGGGGGGTGDVTSTAALNSDNALTRFDGSSGKVIQDSGITVTDADIIFDIGGLGVNTGAPSSTVHIVGSLATNITTISSGPSNLSASHSYILANAGSGGFTINLPTASGAVGRIYNIKKIDSTSGVVTISRTGGDTIDGAISVTLTVQYEALTFASDGSSSWYIF